MEFFILGYVMDFFEGNSVVLEFVLVGDEVVKEENKGNVLWLLFYLFVLKILLYLYVFVLYLVVLVNKLG